MKIRYEIEKDAILNTYIVWEMHRNYQVQRFKGFKYQCKEWLKKKVK